MIKFCKEESGAVNQPRRESSTVNREFGCMALLPGMQFFESLPRTLKSAVLEVAGEKKGSH